MRHTILLVDGDDRARWDLCAYANRLETFRVTGQASSYKVARELLAVNAFDIILLDVDLSSGRGMDLAKKIRVDASESKCLVVSNNQTKETVLEAFRCGVNGYLTKDASPKIICEGILQVMSGGAPISPLIAHHLFDHLREDPVGVEVKSDAKLTKRESQVLQLVAKGYSYTEIAQTLSLSYHTISTYIKIIYNKLSVCSRGEAVYEAIRCSLIRVNRDQVAEG